MSIHDGHRQRLRERYRKEGLDHFQPHEVLELMLFYCIPRRDTNEAAHALLKRFKTVEQVLDAPVAELKKVDGVGGGVADFIGLLRDLQRFYKVNGPERPKFLNNLDESCEYMKDFFRGRRNETVFLLCLDAKCKVLSCEEVGEGSVNSAAVPIRRVVEMALAANATSVILAHNHPSGFAVPSDEDVCTTIRVGRAMAAVEIQLLDHVVVADDEAVSMAQSGFYRMEDCEV